METYRFTVAEHTFTVETKYTDLLGLLPNLKPFVAEEETAALFSIVIDNTLMPSWRGNRIGSFPCPSATFEVYRLDDGAYRILISDESGTPCAFFQSDSQCTSFTVTTRGERENIIFGLNNALMVIYTMCTSRLKTLLVHSSVVENNGRGFMFLGRSGRGKSTHSDLWVKHINGSRLINDDNPIIRIAKDGTPYVYGSPWSGKRPVYMNVKYPIGGIAAIEQEKENRIRRENTPTAFGILLSSCSTLKFDKKIHMDVCGTITNILERIPVHTLSCRPDREAAEVSSSILKA